MDQTYIEVIRNFLDSHVDDVLAWYAAKMQHMTSLEPEDFDDRTGAYRRQRRPRGRLR